MGTRQEPSPSSLRIPKPGNISQLLAACAFWLDGSQGWDRDVSGKKQGEGRQKEQSEEKRRGGKQDCSARPMSIQKRVDLRALLPLLQVAPDVHINPRGQVCCRRSCVRGRRGWGEHLTLGPQARVCAGWPAKGGPRVDLQAFAPRDTSSVGKGDSPPKKNFALPPRGPEPFESMPRIKQNQRHTWDTVLADPGLQVW